MPELPEVETVKSGLAEAMAGHRIESLLLRRDDLRFPFPQDLRQRLQGAKIERLGRRAKYILVFTDRDDVFIVHLGMSGRFTILPREGLQQKPGVFYHRSAEGAGAGPHDHVVIDLDSGTRIVYSDPRRFGMMDIVPEEGLSEHRLLRDLGMEPMDESLDAEYLARRFSGRRSPLKAVLLDQRLVAGLGNIYVCEALFRAGLSPERPAGSLVSNGRPLPELAQLVSDIKAVIREAIAAGGSSLRDYAQASGELGYFQHSFDVYDREGQPCRRESCAGTIERTTQGGRSTFHCRSCQR